ncbi:MAG TPA: hypothetical protein VGL78_04325 [Solirubrobacteraceae bacterium]
MIPRAGHLVLLFLGFLVSVAILAIVLPKLAHVAPPPQAMNHAARAAVRYRKSRRSHHGSLTLTVFMWILGVSAVAGLALLGRWTVRVVRVRLENRHTREYGLYELHLTLHDGAREQEQVEMVESLLHAVREFPEERARTGQPFIAFEAHYAPGATGHPEWVLCVRCERQLAESIDAIISAAYPDVRMGYEFSGPPRDIGGVLREPAHVLRFRKSRSFMYPIVGEAQPGTAHPWEAIAQAQAAVGRPSTVRVQMTPCALIVERYARERLRSHEARLLTGDGGTLGSLNRAEMTSAASSQSHAWCWLELVVACDSRETANRIAAAVLARRGENRLQRRWMVLREDLYRRRFPTAYPPLWPSLSLRTLVSSSEVAQLLALPGARMKSVPVRRLALPRVPAPPELGIAAGDPEPELPPGIDE